MKFHMPTGLMAIQNIANIAKDNNTICKHYQKLLCIFADIQIWICNP